MACFIFLSPALITPCPDILAFTLLPVKRFPYKLACNLPNNMKRYPPFSYFASYLFVLIAPVINKSDSSKHLNLFS